jgi:hypothetical protein
MIRVIYPRIVVIYIDRYSRGKAVQLSNREWATTIISVNSKG